MTFREFLKNNIVILDGGMGTLLQAKGLQPGELPERWNLSHSEVIREIQTAYYDAGSNVVSTNTFGANGLKFSHTELEQIIAAAVENTFAARKASCGTQEKFVALDVGPCGRLLKPYGDFDFEDAVALFSEVISVGARCGVDLVLIETMNDSYETKAALLAAKESCDLPVLVSNAYGEDGKLMTGADPAAMVAMLEGMGADAIGANCSLGPRQLYGVVETLLERASVPVLFKPNAGLPKSEGGIARFDINPDEFAEAVSEMVRRGARCAGGCCGTTPEYIAALSTALHGVSPVPVTEKNLSVVSSYTHAVTFGADPVLIGERINPTGKKRFKQALIEHDIDYILNEGLAQQEKGVHVLDVNVGHPEIDEKELLKTCVGELQAIIDLPLQIDTADIGAMELALRRYNGKAMINSVNGKEESMRTIFPLVKKYGGFVVALTLDEGGIPATAEGRVAIARKILATAAEYGIKPCDLIFDTLTMTVSAEPNAANITLESLARIKTELGCNTSLGVSNVSFGLPNRDALNSSFFTLALANGLSAAIMNPYSADMMRAYYTYRALRGLDESCADYIAAADSFVSTAVSAPAASTHLEATSSALQNAIVKGLREQAGELTAALLQTNEPLSLVTGEIIPALDIVGRGFEAKTVYLPQLLMSAEAAKSAFEQIKRVLTASGTVGAAKGPVVIATVHGDIHDIGKNIVRLLLENYGFAVTDLGKDVAAGTIVETVQKLHAPLVGLSALMTTTAPAMAETIARLKEAAPWCRIVVGGAVITREYAESIGADHYARDAMETVRYAEQIMA